MGEHGLREDVVGQAVGELGERVGRAGRDHEQVGAGQVRVEILVGGAPGQRVERLRGDEALGPRRDERHHVVARLDEQAGQLARLVGGDPPRHTQQDTGHGP